MRPKISVITPSFNQGSFLEQTITSVLSQSYENLEFILIDGGSSDNSIEIIRKYSSRITYWESAPDDGQSSAINKGLQICSGDIICWLNSDDTFLDGCLSFVARNLSYHKTPQWLIGGTKVVDKDGRTLYDRSTHYVGISTFSDWSKHWFPQQSTFWNRRMLQQVGFLRDDLHFIMDYDYWIRMFKVCNPILSDELLSTYRYHSDAKCISKPSSVLSELKLVHSKNFITDKSLLILHSLIRASAFAYSLPALSSASPLYNAYLEKFFRVVIKVWTIIIDTFWNIICRPLLYSSCIFSRFFVSLFRPLFN